MPTVQDVIRTIKIHGSADGVDEATASLKSLAAAQGAVAVVSDTTNKSALNVTQAYQRQTLSVDAAAKSAANIAAQTKIADAALAQGLITQTEHAARLDQINQKYGQATPLSQAFSNSIKNVQGQMVALSAGMGPVGVFLASFGPWGLAAAAGVGLVSAAIGYMIENANRMGEVARQLRDVSDTANVSTDDLQKLRNSGAEVGLNNDQVTASFERFGVQLAELQKGTGAFYNSLNRVSPALTLQLATTKDTATAWNILAQAYAQADKQQQALISRAAFGRGGAATGRLLTSTAQAGGIQGLQSPDDALTQQQIGHWSDLKVQIDNTNRVAKDLMASIWTDEVLRRELQAAQVAERIAQATKDAATGSSWLEKLMMIGGGAGTEGYAPVPAPAPSRLSAGDLSNPFDSGGALGNGAGIGLQAQFLANTEKATIAALGGAATASEQYHARVLDLDAALEKHTITQDTYNRAVAGAKLQEVITTTQAYVSALGPLATVQDQVKLKTLDLQRAQTQGAGLSKDQVASILLLTQTTAEWSRANDAATIGIYNFASANAAAQNQVKVWVAEGLLDPKNPQQMAQAWAAAAAKMSEVKAKAFDALPGDRVLHDAQFQQQTMFMSPSDQAAANAAKQIDPTNWQAHLKDAGPQMAAFNVQLTQARDLSADFANNFSQAMLQGKNSADALRSAVQSFASTLTQMASKNIVNAAFGGLLGGGTTGGGLVSGLASLFKFADGGIMTPSGPLSLPIHTYATGGVASGPQMAIYGEGKLNEAYVPLPDGRSIPVNINLPKGAAGGPGIVVSNGDNIINVDGNADDNTVQQMAALLAADRQSRFNDTVKIVKDAQRRGMI